MEKAMVDFVRKSSMRTTGIIVFGLISIGMTMDCAAKISAPISLHPDNPRYLFWRGKPTVLVTSGEHYGAVMNAPFDYVAYLEQLQSEGLNLTRIFSGVYCEAQGDWGMKNNTLAPAPGDLLCPFARSDTPGYANGGNKFDLSKWDKAYFARLKDFVAEAGKRGVVVEYTFFCPYYHGTQWSLSPFNPKNNINSIKCRGNPSDPGLLSVQQALVRKVVTALKDSDNIYYEICNEAYRMSSKWQHAIAQTIVETEIDFPRKHLIAQNCRPVWKPVHPAVSIYNFHPVAVNTSVRDSYGLKKLSGLDETSPQTLKRASDYRRWAWTHFLDGGAIYNNLDFSFTVENPRGGKPPQMTGYPNVDMAQVWKQLRILKDFIESFDFVGMKPENVVKQGVPTGGAVHVLSNQGVEYAIYLCGGKRATLTLDLPTGRYRAEWLNTLSGNVDKAEDISHGGGTVTLVGPEYKDDVALRVKKVK
jgi:hypothetical protein